MQTADSIIRCIFYAIPSRYSGSPSVSYTHLDVYKRQTEYLLGSSGTYVVEAHEKGGAKAAKDIEELVSEVTGMFAGGELSEDAIEGAYKDVYKRQMTKLTSSERYASSLLRCSTGFIPVKSVRYFFDLTVAIGFSQRLSDKIE